MHTIRTGYICTQCHIHRLVCLAAMEPPVMHARAKRGTAVMSGDEVKTVPSPRQSSLGYVAVLPDCILSVAIALGWYVRYRAYEHTSILLVGGAGIALIGENSDPSDSYTTNVCRKQPASQVLLQCALLACIVQLVERLPFGRAHVV